MNVLGLIPARGGSKGIPRKNIRKFHGKPLIQWTIEAAKQASVVDSVVVTTEDPEIAFLSQDLGAEVPFLRPPELASDETPGIDPVVHALSLLPQFDWVLLLQPTSPLRKSGDINAICELAELGKARSVVSVSVALTHPELCYSMEDSNRLLGWGNSKNVHRRQDLQKVYSLNGALYLAKCEWLLETRAFVSEETLGYVMPPERSVDIDSPLDWKWAEFLMQERDRE